MRNPVRHEKRDAFLNTGISHGVEARVFNFQENHWDFHVNIYLYMQVSKLLGIMRNNWQLNYGKPFYLYVLVALHEEDSLGSGYIGQQ